MCFKDIVRKLNELDVYPKHGWILDDSSKETACIVTPFVGCLIRIQMELDPGSPHYHQFTQSLFAFEDRLVLYLKSLELWFNACVSNVHADDGFDLIKLHSDLALYEFGCTADSLAKLLPYRLSERPDQVKNRSFRALRKWILANAEDTQIGEAMQSKTDWYDKWDGSAAGKSARDQRTHHHWNYGSFSNVKEGSMDLRLVDCLGRGKTEKCDIIDLLKSVTRGFFAFLGKIIPQEYLVRYSDVDFLGSRTECQTFRAGKWLEELVPSLVC